MKFNKNLAPAISGAKTRKVIESSIDKLSESGIAFASYGVKDGEYIHFPETMDDLRIVSQQVREGSTSMSDLICVARGKQADGSDAKVGWFSVASLRRQDINNVGIDEVSKQMLNDYSNDKDRIITMMGKSIKGTGSVTYNTQKFGDNRRPLTGQSEQRTVVPAYFG